MCQHLKTGLYRHKDPAHSASVEVPHGIVVMEYMVKSLMSFVIRSLVNPFQSQGVCQTPQATLVLQQKLSYCPKKQTRR